MHLLLCGAVIRCLFLFLPGFLFAGHAIVFAQTGIRGMVYDSESLAPLPGATIIFCDDRVSSTDGQGEFFIELSPGEYSFRFQYLGYRPLDNLVQIREGLITRLDIPMDPVLLGIDQVVVSAGRLEQRIAESTVSVSVLNPEDYGREHTTDARDILDRVAGIEVLDGQASIRGGSGYSYGAGSRVLILVDGLPALTPDAGSVRWHSLPLENVSQIEIIKGASSVLYGSSALNGIVNFRTAEATETGSTLFFAESGVFGSPANKDWKWWDTPRTSHKVSLSHNKKYGNTGINAGAFLKIDNSYRKLNDESLARVNFRVRREVAEVSGLSYGIAFNGGITDKYDFLLWEDAERGALKQNPVTAMRLKGLFMFADPFISYNDGSKHTHDLRMRIQASDNQFSESDANNSNTRSVYSEYQALLTAGKSLSVNSGLSLYKSRISSQLYGNHEGFNSSVYSQANFSPSDRLTLVGGVRLEYNELDGESDRLMPLLRAGLNYRVSSISNLRISAGQGYRYPSIAEKFAATTIGAVNIIPNPLIKAESGWNTEAGIKHGLISGNIDGLVDIAVFYGQNKDMIEYVFGIYRNPETGRFEAGFKATNIEFSRVYGLEYELSINNTAGIFKNRLEIGYVFMVPVEFDPSTYRNTGDYLKFRRKHSFSLNMGTSVRNIEAGVRFFARSKILAIDDVFINPLTREAVLPGFYSYWLEKNKSYLLADLSIAYNIGRHYSISAAINNLTNTEYMGRPGDIRPHRSFSLRFSGKI